MSSTPFQRADQKHVTSYFRSHRQIPGFGRLDIELTERCNNNCIHCYINLPGDDQTARSRELTTDEWKRIIREAADLGFLTIRYTGGEPLLRADFRELYLFTRRLGMKVMISTNARLITPELADLFEQIPPLEKIDITAYGSNARTYEAVTRSRGSFREFRNGIRLLCERKIPFAIRGILLPTTLKDIPVLDSWIRSVTHTDEDPSHTVLLSMRTRRDSAEKNQIISRMRSPPEKVIAHYSRNEEKHRKAMGEFCSRFMRPGGDHLFTCGAGQGGVVDAYGMLQPCIFVRDPLMTVNLRKVALKDAIPAIQSRVSELKAKNPDYLCRCAHCFLKGLCEQCPGRSWSEHGTLDTPVDYFCRVAHEQARYLGLIGDEEYAWEVQDWESRVARLHPKDSVE
jgi:radical SAM protein with 4Fe4S-binding SPASM domain